MLETISAYADIGPGERIRFHPNDLEKWSQHPNCIRLAKKWKPAGISELRINTGPDGQPVRVVVEANLTSCLYGADLAYASLTSQDLRPAGSAVLSKVKKLLIGTGLSSRLPFKTDNPLADWTLRRLDPSMTYRLPEGCSVEDVVRSTYRNWDLIKPAQSGVLSHHRSNGETLTLKFANWRSWSIYDKSAEAEAKRKQSEQTAKRNLSKLNPDASLDFINAKQKPVIPSRLMRVEARIFIGPNTSGVHKNWTPTLDFSKDDVERLDWEMFEMIKKLSTSDAPEAGTYFRAFIEAGYSERKALQMTGLLTLKAEGVDPMQGLAPKTAQRLRADVRAARGVLGALEEAPDALDHMTPVLARDEAKRLHEPESDVTAA